MTTKNKIYICLHYTMPLGSQDHEAMSACLSPMSLGSEILDLTS